MSHALPSSKKQATVDHAAMDLINQIEILRQLFPDGSNKKKESDSDGTDGMLYLCRFASTSAPDPSEHKQKRNDKKNSDYDEEKLKEAQIQQVRNVENVQSREKKRQYAISLVTLAKEPTKRVKLVDDGVIEMLIELCNTDDGQLKRSCAATFAYLAGEPSIRNRMIDDGCVAAIFNLSAADSVSIKADCVRALCNLCHSHGSEVKAIRDGACQIVTHIASYCPEVMDICLSVLLNLSCVSERYSKVEDINDAIMQINQMPLTEAQDEIIISTVCNLSALRGNQQRLVEDGCIKIIDRLMVSPNANLRLLAAEVTCNLTSDQKSRAKILENNMLKILKNMSKDSSEFVRTCCIQCYYNLSRDLSSREKMVNADSVPIIIKICLEKVSLAIAKVGAKTLRSLCGDLNIADYLVKEGIMRVFACLLNVDDPITRQFVAEAVCTLFQSKKILNKLIEQGAVGLIVKLAHSNESPVTGEWCAYALYNLASSSLCPPRMLVEGVLPCLIKLCDESTTKRAKLFCAAAFSHITKQKTVDSSCAIPMLVHMLRHETETSTKSECAAALYNLADSDSCCDSMLSAGALMPIVRLIKSEFMVTKIKCAAILSRLSLHSQYYSQFGRSDVLQVLLELACVDHTLTQRRVVIALSNLSQSAELRRMLLSMNDTIHSINSLLSKPDENLRRGCTAIICNLSYEVGSGREMMRAEIIGPLLVTALVTSDQIDSKIICVKALLNIMDDPDLHAEMVEKDVVWGLSTLAQVDSPEILLMCARALCCLSTKFAKDMLPKQKQKNSSAVIKIVVKLIQMENDFELLKLGAITLTNMLIASTNDNEAFRSEAADKMTILVQSKDAEVQEMCVLCLCFASQSEACRSVIINRGLLQHMDSSKIFAEPRVSYAYLAMFENIANNPAMRSRLLDDHLVERFGQVCKSNDQNLNLAVAKALYCISCDDLNIIKLADQNVLPVVLIIWHTEIENPSSSCQDLLHHLVAVLYNMCTNDLVPSKLVTQGIVRVFLELWSQAILDFKYCELVYLAVAHLATMSVNTVKMVEDGCVDIICFLFKMKASDKKGNKGTDVAAYNFNDSVILRVAAALRNLLCISENQPALVEGGCIETLVIIASDKGLEAAREDASSALRSLTYNEQLREKLLSTGAIDIMLKDVKRSMKGEFLPISHNLLSALESESWGNGSRGAIKEGRSDFNSAGKKQPLTLFSDLIKGATHIQANFDTKTAKLERYLVQIQLVEPSLEQDSNSSDGVINISDLSTFSDTSTENNDTIPMTKPKVICEILQHSIYSLKRGIAVAVDEDEDQDDSPEDNFHLDFTPIISDTLPSVNTKSLTVKAQGKKGKLAAGVKKSQSVDGLPQLGNATKKKVLKPDASQQFANLVTIINQSKRTNGALIEDVSAEWRKVSQY